jgi:hypothetical protein
LQESRTITLHYKRETFESIYYANGEDAFLKNKETRTAFLILFAFALVWVFALAGSINSLGSWIGPVIVISVVLGIPLGIAVLIHFIRFNKYRRSTEKLIKDYEGTTETITFTDATITVVNARQTVIARWPAVTQVKITPTYVSLFIGTDYHILPKSSMSETDCEVLVSFVSEKMQGVPDTEV